MSAISEELKKQVEAAYDYRGHVTLRLIDGTSVEGFVFNRQYESPGLREKNFLEIFTKGGGDRKKYSLLDLRAIELTGEDFAAGKSFEDHQKKQKQSAKNA